MSASTAKRNVSTFHPSAVPAAATDFIDFVNASPSPFHAVQTATARLFDAGFTEIKEKDAQWAIQPNGKYFFTRNKSSIVAFAVGGQWSPDAGTSGVSIVAAHTDSPCLKLKPVSKKQANGYLQVGVQCYGGGLWHTWFDRDLSIAGRVLVQDKSGQIQHRLLQINRPILRIPNLAIHLNRGVNDKGFDFNKESQLTPILATLNQTKEQSLAEAAEAVSLNKQPHHPVLMEAIASELNLADPATIKDFELCLYDTQPSTIGGLFNEFIFSPRLDNLMMSYCSLQALIGSLSNSAMYGKTSLSNDKNIRLVALFDNEEVGSDSAYGAGSSLLEHTLRRLLPTNFESAIHRSFLISADMAHAIHPNYADKHEENHRPQMHEGVVIKVNANQRYATTAPTSLLLKLAAEEAGVPLQEFVVRNDSACGSTIGPILSTNLGMRTVDVGSAQLAMHSIREMCGTLDVEHAIRLFHAFFDKFVQLDERLKVD